MRPGFCIPVLSGGVADCRSRVWDRKTFSLRKWLLDEETQDRTLVLQRSGRFQDQSEGWIDATAAELCLNPPKITRDASDFNRCCQDDEPISQESKAG